MGPRSADYEHSDRRDAVSISAGISDAISYLDDKNDYRDFLTQPSQSLQAHPLIMTDGTTRPTGVGIFLFMCAFTVLVLVIAFLIILR